MPGYVPRTNGRKQRDLLEKRLRELQGAHKRQANQEVMSRIIEKVRHAQLGVLKCLHQANQPGASCYYDATTAAILRNIENNQSWWDQASHADILHFFREELLPAPISDIDGDDQT